MKKPKNEKKKSEIGKVTEKSIRKTKSIGECCDEHFRRTMITTNK